MKRHLVGGWKRALYRVTTLGVLFLALTACGDGADTLATVYSFTAVQEGRPSIANPALLQGSDGLFYGTTYGDYAVTGSVGTIYRLTPGGTLTTLHVFNGTDGGNPASALIEGSDGNFYGTTNRGGAAQQGTIYRLAPDGTLTTLHSFNGPDGSGPNAALLQGSDGNFYGTTLYGGPDNDGTIYRLTPGGTLTTLHNFSDDENGARPSWPLVQGSDGNFYGIVGYNTGFGLVYRLTPDGTLTSVYRFATIGEGIGPGPLLAGKDGNLYGMTYGGGPDGAGIVYRLTPSGTLTTLHAFTISAAGFAPDGLGPVAGLTQDGDGNLYGVTSNGYENDDTTFSGTAFRLAADGTLTTLHKFTDTLIGGGAFTTPLLARDGLLYGVTAYGGASEAGSVFRVTTDSVAAVVAPPPVSTLPEVEVAVASTNKISDTETGQFQLMVSPVQTTDLVVAYQITGSGEVGVDYLPLKGVAKIKAGRAYKTINLHPIAIPPGAGTHGAKSVKLTILPSDSYTVGVALPSVKIKIVHP